MLLVITFCFAIMYCCVIGYIFQDGVSIHSTKDRADLTHLIIEENGQMLHILEVSVGDNGNFFYYIHNQHKLLHLHLCVCEQHGKQDTVQHVI